MTLEEHLTAIDDMLARGELSDDDHALARARAMAATRRGQPLPPLPGLSRFDDRQTRSRDRRHARDERHATGISRVDQQHRDGVTRARQARDDEIVRLQGIADRALAAGRMSATEHTETRSRLEQLAREPVRPAGPTVAADDLLVRLAAALEYIAD